MITKLRSTGDIVRKQGSGRPQSTSTNEALAEVADLVLSQEDRPQTQCSTRKISCETGISCTTVMRIIHDNFQLRCLKKRRAQELTAVNKIT